MAYTIPNTCLSCGTCQPQCPTGAIQIEGGEYWIEPGLCNNCEGYAEPQCVAYCESNVPMPLPPKKGRYKTDSRIVTNPDLFPNDKNHSFASAMIVWEACNLLAQRRSLPWKQDEQGNCCYERPVKQGQGRLAFWLAQTPHSTPAECDYVHNLSTVEALDIRAACLHLIYAAYATTLERPWEQEFVISDRQIEKYLGLDKRKDLSKAAKLTLIKTLAQQPCQMTAAIDWPQQGKLKGFNVQETRLWHLVELKHHFQEDDQGCKHLVGITLRLRAGLWAQYFLNKQGYKTRNAFYQYGSLPKFMLSAVTTIWQQHEGAARLMLWLLFKVKVGKQQRVTVPTLMRIAYGEEKVSRALVSRDTRKRLLRTFEGDLEVLNHYGLKPVFDPATYKPEIQPLWAKLAELPDDAEEALDFWIDDGSNNQRLTDSTRGKWNLLMKARILEFELPPEWEQQLAKLETKKLRRTNAKPKAESSSALSAEQILVARKRQGISQRALAQMTGKSQSWVRDVEKGRLSAKAEDRALLRKALEL